MTTTMMMIGKSFSLFLLLFFFLSIPSWSQPYPKRKEILWWKKKKKKKSKPWDVPGAGAVFVVVL